jgi:hypothetical protein
MSPFRRTALLGLIAVSGCSTKDAIDTLGTYGVTEGNFELGEVAFTTPPELAGYPEPTETECSPMAPAVASPRCAFAINSRKAHDTLTNKCLNKRTVFIAGWGPSLSVTIENLCAFPADYIGDYRARGSILAVGATVSLGFE